MSDYDLTTPAGRVRLLIGDLDAADTMFEESAIVAFLAIEGGDVRLAAAQALDTMASNEAMVSKVIRTQDLSTDGAKVAAELRARATELRRQVDAGHGNDGPDGDAFAIVDFVPYPMYL